MVTHKGYSEELGAAYRDRGYSIANPQHGLREGKPDAPLRPLHVTQGTVNYSDLLGECSGAVESGAPVYAVHCRTFLVVIRNLCLLTSPSDSLPENEYTAIQAVTAGASLGCRNGLGS